ncbi:MAG: hypothetical protein OHK0013_27150 [Sandaracinaceae bacterium]
MSSRCVDAGQVPRALVPLLAAGALTSAACQQAAIAATPRTFNRPIQAAFACLETATGAPRPLADCRPRSDGSSPTGLAMHGLVLQEARGELAAVDLAERRVLDSDPSIPGFTFVPVSPLPTAVVVPAIDPRCAFVASAGADVIDVIDLRTFRRESAGSADRYEPFALPGAPATMVLSPTEDALWVAMPDRSSVARIGVSGCALGPLEEIPLGSDVPTPVVAMHDGDLGRYCPLDFTAAPEARVEPREATPLDVVARPASLAVGRELLVGDRALPLVHRIDLDTGAVLAPFSVGAPIRALAVTPEVPDAYDPASEARSRYVYAIDDEDGTVMAIDYGDPASLGFGAVLGIGVESSERPDRMPFLVGARTLEVLTPRYEESDPFASLCDPFVVIDGVAAPAFGTLRGVFLAVGMTDATVRFVDVFDSDAPCRGRVLGSGSAECASGSDAFVYIRRHRPRLGERRTTIGVSASDVSFIVNGATLRLAPEGATTGPDLDEIDCAAEAGGLDPIFGSDAARAEGRGLVCGHADPYAAFAETWTATWDGPLSGAASSTGNFQRLDASTVALDARIDFCAVGALGVENLAGLPPEAPESALGGDVVAITTPLPEASATDERCRAVVGIEGSNQTALPVLLPIRSAATRPDGLRDPYRGRLLLDASAPVLDRMTPGLTLADVLRCFGDELVRFDVRVRGAFSVIGSRTGQRHRVVRGDDGRCEVDPSLPSDRMARAFPGQTYANGIVGFRVPAPPTVSGTELRVTIGNAPATLNIDVGALTTTAGGGRGLALPTDVVWNDINERLYIVDVERRGLLELTTEPLQYTSSRFE